MKKMLSLTFLFSAALIHSGCGNKDEDPKPENKLNGTYQFMSVYLQARTESSQTVGGIVMKSETEVEYTSTENTGMVVIEGNTMTSTGFGYKINAIMKVKTTGDDDPMEVPFTFTMPKSNSVGTFKYIGTDSVFMEKGFTQIPSTGQQMPTVPNATKYAIVNGELIFSSVINQSRTEVQQGVTTQIKQTGLAITRLKKM